MAADAAASPQPWSLTRHLLATQKDLYVSATQHPFLLAGAEGRLPKDVLSRWLANDRLYIHSYIRAAGTLLASIDLPTELPGSQDAPETQLVDWLVEALVGIRKEERFFIDVASRYGLGIEFALPFPPASGTGTQDGASHPTALLPGLALMHAIFSSVDTPPHTTASPLGGRAVVTAALPAPPTPPLPWLEGALTFWGTERCYLDAWSWARDKAREKAQSPDSSGPMRNDDADSGALRKEFIPNWSSPEFAKFVGKLGNLIDDAVDGVLAGKEGEEFESTKAALLGRVEPKWRTLLEAERQFWPDV
ncbi:hypothetical protein C8A05DRAFT_46256 [Staphylotrichum tortipilum]|uniref:Thiaminase-2/PQQC domain-containing protein n=1 Tax=Staphylotrichum tortipilum TaxID=2831512 RepID=A0AAN6RRS1_9PEZI|nr:hypothetical protein C8A05DRAFT_46256 [Staphylotrichum longicolle]